jgi:hypothetical protein
MTLESAVEKLYASELRMLHARLVGARLVQDLPSMILKPSKKEKFQLPKNSKGKFTRIWNAMLLKRSRPMTNLRMVVGSGRMRNLIQRTLMTKTTVSMMTMKRTVIMAQAVLEMATLRLKLKDVPFLLQKCKPC